MVFHHNCGTLPMVDNAAPPTKFQIDACSREIKWTHTLLRATMLGDLPALDNSLKHLLQRAVLLEPFDEVLTLIPAAPSTKVNKAVKQLWHYSSVTASGAVPDLQAGLISVDSIFLAESTNNVCSLMPSTCLLQRCVSLATTYASMTMAKLPRWKGFREILTKEGSEIFIRKALELEAKSEKRHGKGSKTNRDAFADMFDSIQAATEIQITESPASSHLREAACYFMIATLVARRNAVGGGYFPHLNKGFREKVSPHCLYG